MTSATDFPTAVSQTVRAALEAADVTLEAISDQTAIPVRTLKRRIACAQPSQGFKTHEIELIARALNVEPADLIPTKAVA